MDRKTLAEIKELPPVTLLLFWFADVAVNAWRRN